MHTPTTITLRVKFFLLFLFLSTVIAAQRQHLLFESTFEGNNVTYRKGFANNHQYCCDYSVTRTMAAARTGASAVRFELRHDDALASSSRRAELTIDSSLHYYDSGERWYGMSFYLTNWIRDDLPQSILQWHPDSSGGTAVLSLQAYEGKYRIVHGPPSYDSTLHYEENDLLGSPVTNVWTDFVLHVKWDTTSNGYIEVWKNGVKVYDTFNIRTEYWTGGQYIKIGINHWMWAEDSFDVATERIFYIDDLRIGDGDATYDDIAPSKPPRQNLIFETPFEGTDYLNGYSPPLTASCCVHSIQQSRDVAREGAYSTRLEINNTDDMVSGSIGAELTQVESYDVGERWYGMSYYFKDYVSDVAGESILNWHPNTDGGGPALALFMWENTLTLVHQIANDPYDDYHYEDLDEIPVNEWVDFVFHVKWTEDETGFIEFYMNGVLKYSIYDIRTDWTDGQFLKIGVNKWCWSSECDPESITSQRIIYVDAVRIGDENSNYASVAPGGVTSCTEPTATITATETCAGAPYYLVLSDATGTGPFDLWINNQWYYGVAEGDSITMITPVEENIWGTANPPGNLSAISNHEGTALELGIKFSSSKSGYAKSIRFFSSDDANGHGTYIGHLWRASNHTLIDSAIFSGVSNSGWQEAPFSSPVLIDADSLYIVSYNTSAGEYISIPNGTGSFNSPHTGAGGSLTAPIDDGDAENGNGVYAVGSSPSFPNTNYIASNYYVDVVFTPAAPDSFQLLGVLNGDSCFRTGDLQMLTVENNECIALRRVNLFTESKPKNTGFGLKQNQPNPFRGSTLIQYNLSNKSNVNLLLFDMNGRLIRVLANGIKDAGLHSVRVDSRTLASGIYYYRIQAGNYTETKKMVIQ